MDNHLMLDLDIIKDKRINASMLALFIYLATEADKDGILIASGEELKVIGRNKDLQTLLSRINTLEECGYLERLDKVNRKSCYKLNRNFYYKG